jgi:hypothetical protein
MKTLADIKRRAKLGAKLTLIHSNMQHRFLNVTRQVVVMQSNSIGLAVEADGVPSWFEWPKANTITIIDADTFRFYEGVLSLTYKFEAEYSTDVMSRDMLDDEHAARFDKPWLLQYPDGTIEQFDSEDAACARQRALG